MNAFRAFSLTKSLLLVPAIATMGLISKEAISQSCPNEPPPGPSSYPPNSKVYYQFDAKAAQLPTGKNQKSPQDQIKAALDAWSAVNQQSGGDGITFSPSDSTHPASLTISSDPSYTGGRVAETVVNTGTIGAGNPATIVYHPYAQDPNGTPYLAPGQPYYESAYLELTLHEGGHLQGMGDFDSGAHPEPLSSPNSSVLQSFYYQNDKGVNTHFTAPSPCDKVTAASDAAAAAGGQASSGGSDPGSGPSPAPGGPSGGAPVCSDGNDYFDSSSNTVYGYC